MNGAVGAAGADEAPAAWDSEAPAAGDGEAAAAWCDRCGGELGTGDHRECAGARVLEPPRFCPVCGRRMKVQVLPAGWVARCARHGQTRIG